MFSAIGSFVSILKSCWINIWAVLWYLTSYLIAQWRFIPSIVQNIRILTPPLCSSYENTSQIFCSIRLFFVGILTSFEGHFGLFYDTWRHIWRQNVILPLQKVKISKFWHHNQLSIQKNSPIRILRPKQSFNWDIWRFRWFWNVLGRFGSPWRHKRDQDFIILNFWLHHWFSYPKILNLAHI